MISSIPTDLEQYSQRLIDYCDSLSASAYVNFHRLFLMCVVKSNPNKMMLDMYVVWLHSLFGGSRRTITSPPSSLSTCLPRKSWI